MNRPPKKTIKKRPKSDRSAQESKEKDKKDQENRDPAVVRAEKFRVAMHRETVEAFVVAFILALLFRAFLAEAFVIPTGSMAPTLMGAHKDIVCQRCSTPYRCGASLERKEPITRYVVVATICPNCRHTNPLDLKGAANDATFNGDRILVSKFSYALQDPERWDVIVFKYPGNPKQNYIKRLVGLPNETVTIRHGDVYVRTTGDDRSQNRIARKPPDKLLAMRHLVYDTDHQSPTLIKAGYPSRWQPWTENASEPPTDSWKIERDEEGLTANLEAKDDKRFHWLRYYHRWADQNQWDKADRGASLADVDPYSSRLISDFYAYNAYINVFADNVFVRDQEPATFRGSRWERILNGGYSKGTFRDSYQSGIGPEQFGRSAGFGSTNTSQVGMHWVGDLMLEADVETSEDAQELVLELVEAGVKYRCQIYLPDGSATLSMDDVDPRLFDDAAEGGAGSLQRKASTAIRAGNRHEIRFSNFDDQLLLWVDGSLVEFDGPTTFDSREFRGDEENIPIYLTSHPLDAAPVAVAVRGGKSTVHQMRVDRDKYYIATNYSGLQGLNDYEPSVLRQLPGGSLSNQQIQEMFALRNQWTTFGGWQARRSVEFVMEEDQFFPMGDNSPESLDARCWAGTKVRLDLPGDVNEEAYKWTDKSYVPRDLLVGKALVVFWPHSWNAPIPFTPNVKRMKVIR